MSKLNNAAASLEFALVNFLAEFRTHLGNQDHDHLTFNIDVSGPTLHGDLKVTFELGSSYSFGAHVKSGNLQAAIQEYDHRRSFAKRHDALTLSYSPPVSADSPASEQE